MLEDSKYSKKVRDQYESFPFPRRDPADEKRFLVVTPVDILAKINHYCFAGKQTFDRGFRALVAGAGTGDSAIFLAQQLRGRNAEVVYLDLSTPSMDIARQRAAVRGLENIRWVHASILDLPNLDIGAFDYINCLGVLHHLEDPDEGLRCLCSVLAGDGAMGLMLYGRYGRAHVYQIQELMRAINTAEDTAETKVENARTVLRGCPPTNLFRRREGDESLRKYLLDSASLYDDLMSEQDRPYTVPEVYGFLEGAGLGLVEFTTYQGLKPTSRLQYRPSLFIHDPVLLERISRLDLRQQQHIAEVIDGSLSLHTFYASRQTGSVARFDRLENVPAFLTDLAAAACRSLSADYRDGIEVMLRNGLVLRFRPKPATAAFVGRIDGARSIGEIVGEVSTLSGLSDAAGDGAALLDTIRADLDLLNAFNWIVLRDPGGAAVAPLRWRDGFASPYVYEEPVVLDNAP